MKLVIDISDNVYEGIKKLILSDENIVAVVNAFRKGKPLPKGHGRLIDADELEELFGKKCVGDCGACMPKRKTDGYGRWYDTCLLIDDAPTIAEADTESEEV